MLPDIAADDLAAAVEEVAGEVLAVCGATEPPVDCLALAEHLRLTVAWDEAQQARARFVRKSSGGGAVRQGAILLRPEPREERRQWAVAHEIGEHLAGRVFAALCLDPQSAAVGTRESLANRLAGSLLLPLKHFARCGTGCGWDLPAMKRCFSTASHELIARRMLDCLPTVIVTIFDQGRRTLRAGNSGDRPPLPWPVELRCWREAHESARPCTAGADGLTVQAWPIHEPGWRREILRTVTDEWFEP